MPYVTIKIDDVLHIRKSSDHSMYVLGECLVSDVRYGGGKRRINWIKDERYQAGSSNLTFMEKDNGNILIGNLFDKDPYEYAFEAPIPVIIDLLEQWDTVCKTNPDEVTVYYENGKFRVEGKKISK
jgi:hypothetical protein